MKLNTNVVPITFSHHKNFFLKCFQDVCLNVSVFIIFRILFVHVPFSQAKGLYDCGSCGTPSQSATTPIVLDYTSTSVFLIV